MALDAPPAAVADLRVELSAQLRKNSHLNNELVDLQQGAEDHKMSLTRAQKDFALLEQRYHTVRGELSSLKVELFQSQETVKGLTIETSDMCEDLAYQATLVEALDAKNKAHSIKHNEQRLLIQDLREALHSTTSVGCQTSNITTLLGSMSLSTPDQPPVSVPVTQYQAPDPIESTLHYVASDPREAGPPYVAPDPHSSSNSWPDEFIYIPIYSIESLQPNPGPSLSVTH